MASLTRWTWVWVNSGSWWWTGRPGVLWFMGSQGVGHDWATDLIWGWLSGFIYYSKWCFLILYFGVKSKTLLRAQVPACLPLSPSFPPTVLSHLPFSSGGADCVMLDFVIFENLYSVSHSVNGCFYIKYRLDTCYFKFHQGWGFHLFYSLMHSKNLGESLTLSMHSHLLNKWVWGINIFPSLVLS